MNKQSLLTILLAIVCLALAIGLYRANENNARLQEQAEQAAVRDTDPSPEPTTPSIQPVASIEADSASDIPLAADPPESTEKETATRRMMKNMAKMMENPTMNKVMEASQRGAVSALYSDLIEYLNLNAEETEYFMDLLMYRQMKQMDLGMKMMSGTLSDEEKDTLTAAVEEADDTVKEEMEAFLNNPDDYSEWEFYEKTMGERMMLSQMDQMLAGSDAVLSDEAYRELLGMMHDERTDYTFTSDLNDNENMDMSPERFSRENVDSYANDVRQLNDRITARAEDMLTPEQFAAFGESLKATTEMQLSQLEMAAQMLGGGEQPTAPSQSE